MYGLKNVLDKQPLAISGAVKALIAVGIAFQVVHWTDSQIVTVLVAVELLLGLFVGTKTANKAVLSELAQDPPTVDGVPAPVAKAKR